MMQYRPLYLLLLFLLGQPGGYAEQMFLETVQLQHRSANEIIPIIRPFLQNGGAISGNGYKLFIRTTPSNLTQLKKFIAEADTALTRLQITVSNDRDMVRQQQSARIEGQIKIGEDATASAGKPAPSDKQARLRVYGTEARRRNPDAQRIQAVAGQWATITTGRSIPVADRVVNSDGTVTRSVTYKNVTTGFMVLPRVQGDQLVLHIRPHQSAVSRGDGGQIDIQSMETTVSGRLGEWIELGGVLQSLYGRSSGTVYRTGKRDEYMDYLSIKVDKLP